MKATPGTNGEPRRLTIASDALAWTFDWSDGPLRTVAIANRVSGHSYVATSVWELDLTFSGASDRLSEPVARVSEFAVCDVRVEGPASVVFDLHCGVPPMDIALHCCIEGHVRRKWVEITNRSGADLLLLDVTLDDLMFDGVVTGGGQGEPVFLDQEAFAAIEHPAGLNEAREGHVLLMHRPGKLLPPGAKFRSRDSLFSVAAPGHAAATFVAYIQDRCLRRKSLLAVYTPFGINNQWGACPTLDDEQTLDVLGLLDGWRKRSIRFDYFTLDTGWMDPDSDMTRFRPVAFPEGPADVIAEVRRQGTEFGLWFPLEWGTQACWDYPPAFADGTPPGLPYKEGYPLTAGGLGFCLGDDRYFGLLRNAVLRHVRENRVRFIKLDGGVGPCDSPDHGHLPGAYSIEMKYDRLIELANEARAIAPDLFVMWYWGLRSPFWALHGDTIFESGLHMEGSGTSATPTLYYRDSVTLAQDQNAQYARLIPALVKDSLGVWLADTRWGNFMGKERWREALVMDLGRGNLLFPNLWGNLYHLADEDVRFLADMQALARQNEGLLLQPRRLLGDAWKDAPYGYAYFQGAHGLLFLNNAHFTSRPIKVPLDQTLGLEAADGKALRIESHFPDRESLAHPDGSPYCVGEQLDVWLRPFETLLLEVRAAPSRPSGLPHRAVGESQADALGVRLALKPAAVDPRMGVRFADEARFEEQGHTKRACGLEGVLPPLAGDVPILAVVVRLRCGDGEWRYAPKPVEIVQALARVGDHSLSLIPVPDGRQHGNTQAAGASWVLYKTRLSREWSGRPLKVAVHAWLPAGVEAEVTVYVVRRWWRENSRPSSDGYYMDAPT